MDPAGKPFPLTINRKLCKKCGICMTFCPIQVFTSEMDGSPVIGYPEKCIECKMCVMRCPEFAISWEV